jgi:hypothetical protein
MTVHRRTEITVETERVLIIRQHRSVSVRCQECGRRVNMVSLGEAEALTEILDEQFGESASACRNSESRAGDGRRMWTATPKRPKATAAQQPWNKTRR